MFTTLLYRIILQATHAMWYAILYFSNLNVHTKHQEILLKCNSESVSLGAGPKNLHFCKFPCDTDASDPQTTI